MAHLAVDRDVAAALLDDAVDRESCISMDLQKVG
jgi:hypothetical protein